LIFASQYTIMIHILWGKFSLPKTEHLISIGLV